MTAGMGGNPAAEGPVGSTNGRTKSLGPRNSISQTEERKRGGSTGPRRVGLRVGEGTQKKENVGDTPLVED